MTGTVRLYDANSIAPGSRSGVLAHAPAMAEVLLRLASTAGTTAELTALAPELVCALGFERALISRVANGVWYPERMYVVGDPAWAEQIGAAGRAQPMPLQPGLHETTLVQQRRPILVHDAQNQMKCRWGHPALMAASKATSYVAAPISSGAEVVGILTADRYGSGREVDGPDRDLLAAFAAAFALALARAALSEDLDSVQQMLVELTASIGTTRAKVLPMPVAGVEGRPGGLATALPGSPTRVPCPLPANLTPRELEVLELMTGGLTNLAIARALFITDGTVKQHVKHILRKLRAANRSEAVARWFQADGTVGTVRSTTRLAPTSGRHHTRLVPVGAPGPNGAAKTFDAPVHA